MVLDQLFDQIDLMCSSDIDQLRAKVEHKLKVRLVNSYEDLKNVCTRNHSPLILNRVCLASKMRQIVKMLYI